MRFLLVTALLTASHGTAQPRVDHHLHFLKSMASAPPGFALDADELIRQMDAAGVRRGVVLSVAYHFGNPFRPPVANEYARVRAENDWSAAQAKRYPDRLIVFCGINPLQDYALREIRRCAGDPLLRRGLKLHFGNSDVEMDKPRHIERLQMVFAAANRYKMPIVVHLRPNIDHQRPWESRQARIFLEQVLPRAPGVVVQIAHLAGPGRMDSPGIPEALEVFSDAIAARDPRVENLYFDLAVSGWEAKPDLFARQLRRIGLSRLLYGSDSPPDRAWKEFRKFPLTAAELQQIEENIAPYLR